MEKKSPIATHQLEFFRLLPHQNRPSNIAKIDDETYSYDRISGRHPTTEEDWIKVWIKCCGALWGGRDLPELVDIQNFINRYQLKNVDAYYIQDNIHPVRLVHGRLRAEHIVIGDEITFLSPGVPELMCKEYDEASMLMTLITQYETKFRKWRPYIGKLPFQPNKIHLWFLIAHWKRENCWPEIVKDLEALSTWDAEEFRTRLLETNTNPKGQE